MSNSFEVAIIGAGPAGISAACKLADRGVETIVFERGEFPGAKNVSGGVLYGRDLERIVPDFAERKCPVERNIVESRMWYLNKDGGYSLSCRDAVFDNSRRYNVFTVGRAKFDRWFADQASEKGVVVVCGTVVTDLLRDDNKRVTGVRTDRPDGDLQVDVVLLADGINSPLAAKTGFRPEPSPDHVALAVKEVIELPEDIIEERFNVDHQNGVTIEILGDVTYGMNGVAVIYTNRKSLSLCIGANLADLAAGRIKPYDMMEAFKKHPMVAPLIKGGKPVEYMAHWLPEGGILIYRTFAATDISLPETRPCFFNTLHREGSNLAMISGTFAAEAILEAREKRDFGRHTLNGYLRRLERSVVLRDLKKYRHFNSFLQTHKEIFTTLPQAAGFAAREMLTVNGVPKKEKQKLIWRNLRKRHSLSRLTRLLVDAFRGMGCRLP